MQFDGYMANCGQWHLVREIGRGAYGVVYLAVGTDGRKSAVKVCRRADIGDERYARELRGAKLYSAIPPQEGLVCMRELAEAPWGFYAVMDLADDEFGRESPTAEAYRPKTLASVIEGVKALPLGECMKLGITLAKGLAELQRHHLLHRDIKPGNVIYVEGRPALSDPGLVVEESEAASLVGTPGYVPPENFTAAAGDVYSIGLTLKAASFGRRVEDLDKGPAQEADTGATHFPAWWRILNKATDPTPSCRYQSAKALLKDLEGLRRKIALTSIARSRAAKVAAMLVALGIVSAIVFAVVASRHATDESARQAAENKAAVVAIYERALRENFDGILSDERIKEEAQKAVAGEKVSLTPEESKAFSEKMGLGKVQSAIKDSIDRLSVGKKNLDK
jgi:serine/threonine protein kinase